MRTQSIAFVQFMLAGLLATPSHSQTSIDKHIDTGVKIVNGVKGIFGKKDGGVAASAQQAAGGITNKTVFIDADQLFPFVEGAAIIKKGTATAVINSKGEFIFPYNKFKNITSYGVGFLIADGKIYNSKGKFMTDKINNLDMTNDNYNGDYLVIDNRAAGKEVIDYDGNKRIITKSGKEILGTVYKNCVKVMIPDPKNPSSNDYLYGLKGLDNKTILPCRFNMLFEFKDGYSCFGIKDQFGEMAYGVVNDKGVTVVEAKYSNRIFMFGEGYSGFVAHNSQDYKSGILNNKGAFVYKAPKTTASGAVLADCISGLCINYEEGYFFNHDVIVDQNGKASKALDFLKAKGLRSDVKSASFLEAKSDLAPGTKKYTSTDGCISFFYTDPVTKDRSVGVFLPSKNKLVTGGNFQEALLFDPVSKLSLVSQKVKETGKVTFNKGYVDENGDFVLLMKTAIKE